MSRPELRRIRLPGLEVSGLELGPADAPVALCLHGFPDVPRTWTSLMYELAAAGYRAVAPWMPGYAPSGLVGPFDQRALAAQVLAMVDALSPNAPVAVVGHDWGAAVTYPALQQAPARFRRAVTLSVPHPMSFLDNLRRHPRQLRRSWYMGFFQLRGVAEQAIAWNDFALIERLWTDWSPGYHCPPDYMDELKQCLAASLPAPLHYYREMFAGDVRAEMAAGKLASSRIRVPVLYLHGADDGCIGPEMADGQALFFDADNEQRIVARAGHFLQLERPAEVNACILGWLGPAS